MNDLMPLVHRMCIGILVGIALARPLLEWFFRDGQDRDWAAYAHSLLLQMDFGAPVAAVVLMVSGTLLTPGSGPVFRPVLTVQLVLFVLLLFTIGILNSPLLRQRAHLAREMITTRLSTAQIHQMAAINRRENLLMAVQLGLLLLLAVVSV